MEDMFYCHSCVKYKKVSVRAATHICAACAEKATKCKATQTRRFKQNTTLGKRYKSEAAITRSIKHLLKGE